MGINSRGGLRSHSLTPVSVGSSPPRPCAPWVDRPTPALPAALSLLLPVTGPGERGGGKSHSHLVQPDQRGLRWEGGVGGHVSLHISDKTALPAMTFCLLGITCFVLERDGLHFYIFP